VDIKLDQLKLSGIYRGIVVDNVDSSKFGRIKVKVHGLFDDVNTGQIPWAKPALPIFTGAGVGYGNFAVPEIGSYVWCFFEAGDVYQPIYFAEAGTGVHGHPAVGDVNYPNRRGFRTKRGHLFYIDDVDDTIRIESRDGSFITMTPTETRIEKSSAYIKIDSSGNITISGTKVDINP
jgi:hypothetical protein